MALEKVDLNLLRVFDAILRERNVTAAAAAMKLTQPAMSNALARLRKLFGDALFVRTPRGMQPTPLAKNLAGPIRQALGLIEATLVRERRFVPSESERVFRLHLSDIGEMVFLPALVERVRREAPHVHVETRAIRERELPDAMAGGEIDLAIGFLPQLGPPLRAVRLFRDSYVALTRSSNPGIGKRLTRRAFEEAAHLLVQSIGGGHAVVEEALLRAGLERRIALRVPHFTVVPMILERTDLVVSVPERVARAFVGMGSFRALPLPVDVPPAEVQLYWHERFEGDPANRWLRELAIELHAEAPVRR